MAIVFPSSPSDGDTVTVDNRSYVYSSSDGAWKHTSSSGSSGVSDDLRGSSATTDKYWGNTDDYIFADADTGLRFYTAGAEDMRLSDAGDLHVDGNVVAYSTTISDEKLKDDIQIVDNAIDKIKQLKGVTFTYKHDGKQSAGVIAQDVEKVLPTAIIETTMPMISESDETYKTVQYDQLVAITIEAIKQQQETIEQLKDEIKTLKENKDGTA